MKQLFLIFAFLIGYSLTASAEKISELSDADAYAPTDTHSNTNFSFFGDNMSNDMGGIIVLISVIMIFGLPLFIVAITLWFRYKNKQAKYKLAAEALAAGHSIPQELFNERNRNNEIMTNGITHIFLGIGLGVFLWVMTGVKGLAAIGFLIFCMGIGQVLIAYTTTPRKQKKDGSSPTRMSGDGHEDTPHNEQ